MHLFQPTSVWGTIWGDLIETENVCSVPLQVEKSLWVRAAKSSRPLTLIKFSVFMGSLPPVDILSFETNHSKNHLRLRTDTTLELDMGNYILYSVIFLTAAQGWLSTLLDITLIAGSFLLNMKCRLGICSIPLHRFRTF